MIVTEYFYKSMADEQYPTTSVNCKAALLIPALWEFD